MSSGVCELNGLIRSSSGVWHSSAGFCADFENSQLDENHKYLEAIFKSAMDLSAHSIELENAIRDSHSEFQLTPNRSNLLRCFSFSDVSNVLEVGCDGGAMSRYFGEQGLQVDVIENNPTRAYLTALRCRDLDDVHVINAAYEDLNLPSGHYDLIFLSDVIALVDLSGGREDKPGETVSQLLKMLFNQLSEDGCIVMTSENRLGLKYISGVPLDSHQLNPQLRGGQAFSYDEWRKVLHDGGVTTHEFLYPFPSHRIPTSVVTNSYLENHAFAYSMLSSVVSRDYGGGLSPVFDEYVWWRSLHEQKQVHRFSNSFLIVAAKQRRNIENLLCNEFIYVSSGTRKPCWRVLTEKAVMDTYVRKTNLYPSLEKPSGPFAQDLGVSFPYVDGQLLSDYWLETMRLYPTGDEFSDVLVCYYSFVMGKINQVGENDFCDTDLIPKNIVIDDKGNYQIIDDEWKSQGPVPADLLLFRAALHFVIENRVSITEWCQHKNIKTTGEFVSWCFDQVGIDYVGQCENFAAQEKAFQQHVNQAAAEIDIHDELQQPIGSDAFFLKLTWSQTDAFDWERDSLLRWGLRGQEQQTVRFDLPVGASNLKLLRLNPLQKYGYFKLVQIVVSAMTDANERVTLVELMNANQIRLTGFVHDMSILLGADNNEFILEGGDPYVLVPLPAEGRKLHRYRVEVKVGWPKSTDYKFVENNFNKEVKRFNDAIHQFNLRQNEYHTQNQFLRQTLGKRLSDAEVRSKQLEKKARQLEGELNIIKQSRAWRLAEASRNFFYKRLLSHFPALQNRALALSRKHVAADSSITKDMFPGAQALATGKLTPMTPNETYREYRKQREITEPRWIEIHNEIKIFELKPKISIVMPVYNVSARWLDRAIESVKAQLYSHWELCMVDDCSTEPATVGFLEQIKHPQINLRRLTRNKNISGATNEAISMSSGDYIVFMDHDDELGVDALFEIVKAVNETGADFIYSDEDFISLEGEHINPHFKPDFSPELLLSHNYITHIVAVKKELLDKTGLLRPEFDGAQDYDFLLRATELATSVHHIPKVLYHWRMLEQSTSLDADIKPQALSRGRQALAETLERRGEDGKVLNANLPHFFRIKRDVTPGQKVSIIFVLRDDPDQARSFFSNILEKTTYQEFELMGVSTADVGDETRQLAQDFVRLDERIHHIVAEDKLSPFGLLNFAVRQGECEHIVTTDLHIDPINWDWLEALLEHSQRQEIGAVGGKIYYPNHAIKHAGMVVGLRGVCGRVHHHHGCQKTGYFNRLNLIQNTSAVSSELMMVKSSVFNRQNGFDCRQFALHGADVDFCLRVAATGLRNVFTPYAQAYSTGEETYLEDSMAEQDQQAFRERHKLLFEKGDPHFNSNLSLKSENFAIRL